MRSGRMREGGDGSGETGVSRSGLSASVSWQDGPDRRQSEREDGWDQGVQKPPLSGFFYSTQPASRYTNDNVFAMVYSRRRNICIFDSSSIWGGKSPRWTLHVLRSEAVILDRVKSFASNFRAERRRRD